MDQVFRVPVAALLRDIPSSLEIDLTAPFDARHEFSPRPFAESDVPIDSEASVKGRIESFRGGLRFRGVVSSPWRGVCRRCSTPILGVIEAPVNERFSEDAGPDDDEAYPIDGDFIDLEAMVHDSVLLELPIAPLCRAECQGLCPICGIDRNESSCDCAPERDNRWATLDALRIEDRGSSEASPG